MGVKFDMEFIKFRFSRTANLRSLLRIQKKVGGRKKKKKEKPLYKKEGVQSVKSVGKEGWGVGTGAIMRLHNDSDLYYFCYS